jgi:hypothetical protein
MGSALISIGIRITIEVGKLEAAAVGKPPVLVLFMIFGTEGSK